MNLKRTHVVCGSACALGSLVMIAAHVMSKLVTKGVVACVVRGESEREVGWDGDTDKRLDDGIVSRLDIQWNIKGSHSGKTYQLHNCNL